MRKNIGSADRIIRLVAGAVIIIAGVYLKSWWGLLGIVLIGTALINWCPIYGICGVKTSKTA